MRSTLENRGHEKSTREVLEKVLNIHGLHKSKGLNYRGRGK